jgi:hypothetical protein
MQLLVTLRAAREKRLPLLWHVHRVEQWRQLLAHMRGVTLQTQEGLVLHEHEIGHRSVRVVADRAAFGHRRMLVDERPFLLRVAAEAELID